MTEVDWPEVVVRGETVPLRVTVANRSPFPTGPVALALYQYSAEDNSPEFATSTIQSISSKQDSDATLRWHTKDLEEGIYRFYIAANAPGSVEPDDYSESPYLDVVPDDDITPLVGSNDSNKDTFDHDLEGPGSDLDTRAQRLPDATPVPTPSPLPTPTPAVDVAITGITASPAGAVMQGQWVDITVTVRNNGAAAVRIPVQLAFPSENKKPERKSPRVAPGAVAQVTFTWKTRNYAIGRHTLRASLPAENNITAGDTAAAIALLVTAPQTTAAIVGIAANPAAATAGEPVAITVQVRNDGPLAAAIPVTLHFPSDDKQPETRRPRVAPGQTTVANFTWRTGNYQPGSHTLRATIAVDESSGATDASVSVDLTAPLVIASIVGITAEPSPAVAGQPVSIAVTVRNDGPVAASIPVTLHFPSDDKRPETRRTHIAPGQTAVATFTWRTRNYQPGSHTLRAAIAVDESPGATDASVSVDLTSPLVIASIVGITAEPSPAVAGQPVSVAVTVRNDGTVAASIPVTLHFPSDDKRPETRRTHIAPGQTAVANFTWRTGNYPPGSHTLRATIAVDESPGSTDASVSVDLTAPPVIASIVGITAEPSPAVAGQPVSVAVNVRNDGPVAANIPVTLHFPSDDKQPETRRTHIAPGQTAVANFTWRTGNYPPGNHTLRATIAVDASSGATDAGITVALTAPPIRASIVGIAAGPSPAVAGQPVSIAVSVRNDGPVAASIPVTLHFPSDDKQPETRRPRIAPGQTASVAFTWRTGNYPPGSHTLRATIAVDESSGATDASVSVDLTAPPVIASIVGITAEPSPAVAGQPVSIAVSVRNYGPVAASIPVTLHFPSDDKQPETRRTHIAPGQTAVATFTWRTGNYPPGSHTLRAVIAVDESSGATDASVSVDLTAPSVIASIVGITAEPSPAIAGQPVNIAVSVRNDGAVAASIPVTLHFPSDDKQPETRRTHIAPGQTAVANFTWRTGNYPPGSHTLRATIAVDANSGATDASVSVALTAPPIRASIVGIAAGPSPAVAGQPVSVAVSVRNDGPVAASIPVTLHFPSDDKQPETRRPRIAPGQTASAAFTWRTGNYGPGVHTLRAEIPDADATIRVELTAPPPAAPVKPVNTAVDIAAAALYPPNPNHPIVKGDWVEVGAFVRNVGAADAKTTVRLWDLTYGKVMYSKKISLAAGESRVIEFTWKTLRYAVGKHTLQVSVDAGYDGNASNDYTDTATVAILPHRDITLGFGGSVPDYTSDGRARKPNVRAGAASLAAVALLPSDIGAPEARMTVPEVIGGLASAAAPVAAAPVATAPVARVADTASPEFRLHQAAQTSPLQCVRYQRAMGDSQPRAALCPQAPALVR